MPRTRTQRARQADDVVATAPRPLRTIEAAAATPLRRWLLATAVACFFAMVAAYLLNIFIARMVRIPDDAELVSLEAAAPSDAAAGGDAQAEEPADARAVARRAAPVPTLDSYVDPILGRSLFDSSNVGQEAGGLVAQDGEELSDLDYELILTSVASDPRYSTAMLRANERGATAQVYGLGDELDDATIDRIERRRIYVVRGNGAVEYLKIGGEQKKSRGGRKKSTAGQRYGRRLWKDGITKVSSTHYRIDRDALDTALGNLNKLSRGARVLPKKYKGQSGYRISRIKSSSPYKYLGLRNNDILMGVNGQSVSDPAQAMEMYNQLKNESSISLDIVRKGREMTIQYDIE